MANKAVVRTEIRADTKHFEVHMKAAQKATDNVRKSQTRLDRQNGKLVKGFSKAAAAASVLHGPLNGVSGRLNAMATALRNSNIAWVAAGTAATLGAAAFTKAVGSLAEFEVQMKRVIAVQEATGYAAGFTGRQIHDMAQSIAADTLASVDGVMAAAAALGTFGSISGDTFERVLRASQDVAETMGTDMQGATIQLAKALEDPVKGLTALTRAGVTFTQETRNQIAAAMEFGRILEAQDIIMAQVESQLGGVGKAVSDDTLIGGWDLFTQRVQTFMRENFLVNDFLEFLKNSINNVNKALSSGLGNDELGRAYEQWSDALDKVQGLERQKNNPIQGFFVSDQQLNNAYRDLERADANYLAVRDKQLDQAAEDEKARQAGLAAQAKLDADSRLAAAEKIAKRHDAIDRKRAQALAKSQAGAAGGQWDSDNPQASAASAIAAESKRLEARIAANDAAFEKIAVAEQLHGAKVDEWRRNRDEVNANHVQEYENKVLAIKKKAAKDEEALKQRQIDLDKEKAEDDAAALKDHLSNLQTTASATSSMFDTVAGMYQEGSAAAMSFAVASRAASLIATGAKVAEGIGQAFADPTASTIYQKAAAVATATALGAQILAMARSSTGSRAFGGPAKPGSYWVGENGPEIVHFNQPAHVTKSSDAMGGGVTVNLIEDASRAGQQSIDEAGIISIAVASIRGELQRDIASGRGIFRQAEQQYGLTRAR